MIIAVATGAIIQLRYLGGSIGLAIASAVMSSTLTSRLSDILSPTELAALLQNVNVVKSFDLDTRHAIQLVFAEIYNMQFKIVAGVAGAQILAIALLWKKHGQLKPV